MRGSGGTATPAVQVVQPAVKVQKMTPADDPEAYLNAFEQTATITSWPEELWAASLIPCLMGPAQQVVDMLPAIEVGGYPPEFEAINLNHPHLMAQHIRATCKSRLHPEVLSKDQIVKARMFEHYTAIFPFKPPNRVLFHQLVTLEEAIMFMEAYASAEASL